MFLFVITFLFLTWATASPAVQNAPHSQSISQLPTQQKPEMDINVKDDVFLADQDKSDSIDTDVIIFKGNGESGEIMKTSENVVFRPLFTYRKLQTKKKRIQNSNKGFSNSPNAIRRRVYNYAPQRFTAYYPQPYYQNPYNPNPYYHPAVYYPNNRYYNSFY